MTNRMPGARQASLSYATAALTGPRSLFDNPAGIAFSDVFHAAMACESRFLLREFSLMAVGVVLPVGPGAFGFSFSQTGSGIYHERKGALTYATPLGREIAAAVQFDLFAEKFPENRDPCLMVTVETGLVAALSGRLHVGVHLFNPVGARMNTPWGKEKPLQNVRCGTAWQPSPQLLFCAEVAKATRTPVRVKSGIEFSPSPSCAIRCGAATSPLTFSLGTGFPVGKLLFDIAFTTQEVLGFSPSATLSWQP